MASWQPYNNRNSGRWLPLPLRRLLLDVVMPTEPHSVTQGKQSQRITRALVEAFCSSHSDQQT